MKWLNSNDVMGLMYNKKKVTISVSVCVSTQHDFNFILPLSGKHTCVLKIRLKPRFDLQNICTPALCHRGSNSLLKVAHTVHTRAFFSEIMGHLYCLIASRKSRHVPCIFSGLERSLVSECP